MTASGDRKHTFVEETYNIHSIRHFTQWETIVMKERAFHVVKTLSYSIRHKAPCNEYV